MKFEQKFLISFLIAVILTVAFGTIVMIDNTSKTNREIESKNQLKETDYHTKEIAGIFNTKEIKSWDSVNSDGIENKVDKFTIGFSGTETGEGIETDYYIYTKEDNGGYLLNKYSAENTYIYEYADNPETSEILEYYKFILLDEEIIQYLNKDITQSKFNEKFHIDEEQIHFEKGKNNKDDKLKENSTGLIYDKVDKKQLTQEQIDLLSLDFPELMSENKHLFFRSADSFILNVPKNFRLEKYKM